MKSFSKYVFATILVLTLGIFSTSVFSASGPNYSKSTEWGNQLGFTGYVQVLPAYNDPSEGGRHAKTGWFRYKNTQDNNTYSTSLPNGGAYDNNIYSKQKGVLDSFNPWAPKAIFESGFSFY